MKRAPIADLKARLSLYLDMVKAGEDVIVTDRGKPIARITPMDDRQRGQSRLQTLLRTGQVRPPVRDDPPDLRSLARPSDPGGRARFLLLRERSEDR